MRLLIDDHIYMIHFRVAPPSDVVKSRGVLCTIHPGPCKEKARPCNTPESRIGTALCSVRDQFVRKTGKKIALTRAMDAFPRELRAKLWHEYLKRVSPKTKHSSRNGVEHVGRIPGGAST
jgi:hypothetical protein